MTIVLASASPRRREICDLLGIAYTVRPASTELDFDPALSADDNVLAVARAKAREVAATCGTAVPVLGADTAVILDDADGYEALGKPRDAAEAKAMLRRLAGREHRVLTGVWVCGDSREDGFVGATTVRFAPMTDADIDAYVQTGDPLDKAGAYGIQGPCARYIDGIVGDFYTVMGLPAAALWRFLTDFSAETP